MKDIFDKIKNTIKTTNKGTIFRTVFLIVAYVNQIVAIIGFDSFACSSVYQWLTFIFTAVITALSYWYNNDWTGLAKTAGQIFNMLKDGKITQDEINNFISSKKKEINEEKNKDKE